MLGFVLFYIPQQILFSLFIIFLGCVLHYRQAKKIINDVFLVKEIEPRASA